MPSSTSSAQVSPVSSSKPEPVPMLDLKRQYESIKDDVTTAIERVLTTQYFIGGPELDAFERESAAYLGARACVGCASGTDALWLALEAGGVRPTDGVITSAFTFFASASSITRCAAAPVFADVDPATLTLNPAAVRSYLPARLRCAPSCRCISTGNPPTWTRSRPSPGSMALPS